MPHVVDTEGAHATAARNLDSAVSSHGDDVGEVILTLNVVVRKLGDALAQSFGIENINTGIDLANGSLGLIGVFMLDDSYNSLSPSQDSSVTRGVLYLGRKNGNKIAALAVHLNHPLKGLTGKHRDVAVGDDDLTVKLVQSLEPACDGVPSAFLLCLDRGGDVGGVLSEMGLYLLATVTHDHDEMFRVKSASRSDRPRQHWPTSNLVQQLRLRRLHASPAAGG